MSLEQEQIVLEYFLDDRHSSKCLPCLGSFGFSQELYKVGIITPKEDTWLLGNLPTAGPTHSWIRLTPKCMLLLLHCVSSQPALGTAGGWNGAGTQGALTLEEKEAGAVRGLRCL